MKIYWTNHYVPDGQLEPDKFNRWIRRGYVIADPEGFKGFYPDDLIEISKDENCGVAVFVAYIYQKGTLPGNVPSLEHRFAASIPVAEECLNGGITWQYNIFGNTLEEVERQVEQHLNQLQQLFKAMK